MKTQPTNQPTIQQFIYSSGLDISTSLILKDDFSYK